MLLKELLLRQETEPRVGVRYDANFGFADKSILEIGRPISNRDRSGAAFSTRKREMEGRIEHARLVRLEDIDIKARSPATERGPRRFVTGFTVLFLNVRRPTASASEPATT